MARTPAERRTAVLRPNAVDVEELARIQGRDALLLVAFPTTGSAANIAAHYLVEQLKLPLVGHLRVPGLESVAAVQEGIVTGCVRIFGGEVACRLEKECPRIYVLTSDIPLPPEALGDVSDAVLQWAKTGRMQFLLGLEAVVRNEGDDTPDVFGCAPDAKGLKVLQKAKLAPVPRALVAGPVARMLLDSMQVGMRSGAIVVEALRNQPDGRAAAALIDAVDRLVPDVTMDAKPLLEEAMRIESEIRKAQEPALRMQQPVQHTFI